MPKSRIEKVQVRLAAHEKARLEAFAADHGLTVSRLLYLWIEFVLRFPPLLAADERRQGRE